MIPQFILNNFTPQFIRDAEKRLEDHEQSNLLTVHHFTAEEDHSETLSIRPIKILLNYFEASEFTVHQIDEFANAYFKEILEILVAIEIEEEDLKETFINFATLLKDIDLMHDVYRAEGFDI
ncbi:MAG TPA: hypothetical protein VJU85_05160 [Nitrososphaeraceae archaeon]|nr:hypothetical protein [Nitrososphaeraceae archaeon]